MTGNPKTMFKNHIKNSAKARPPLITCSITRRKIKRKPAPSGVYRNAAWEPCYPGSSEYRFSGEEIEREPKHQYTIRLIQTVRNNGHVQKDRFPVAVIGYWDIVEDFLDSQKRSWSWQKDVRGINESRIIDGLKKSFPQAGSREYGEHLELIFRKFGQIKKQVLADYKTSEEYPLQMLKYPKINGQNGKSDARSTPGNPSGSDDSETRKRRARCDRVLKDIVSFKTVSNKEMARDIVAQGYKQIAKKCHPDNGGCVEKMQELNDVKKEMLRLLA